MLISAVFYDGIRGRHESLENLTVTMRQFIERPANDAYSRWRSYAAANAGTVSLLNGEDQRRARCRWNSPYPSWWSLESSGLTSEIEDRW